MLSRTTYIEVKLSENRCKKFLRSCLGGVVGAFSGALMPLAQCLLNIRDKGQEKNPVNRLRWPAILDIGASAVVAYGAVVRFGNPALWCICLVEGGLCIYGFIRGIQIARWSKLLEVPKKLWNTEIHHEGSTCIKSICIERSIPKTDNGFLQLPQVSLQVSSQTDANDRVVQDLVVKNIIAQNSSTRKKIYSIISGSVLGVAAGLLMPLVQNLHSILNTKRRWPPLINGGVLTYYALYVGSIYIGPEVSLLLLKNIGLALGGYGLIRGGYIGYKEAPSKVFTLMWQGGFDNGVKYGINYGVNFELDYSQKVNEKQQSYSEFRQGSRAKTQLDFKRKHREKSQPTPTHKPEPQLQMYIIYSQKIKDEKQQQQPPFWKCATYNRI